MILASTAARRYSEELGWGIVPILPGTKRPPERFPLSQYFQRRATGAELDSFFPADRNLAVCLGNVSDGLCVRDFDVASSYDSWAADHPELARQLPTVRTPRPGYHVYFNADVSDVSDLSPSGGSIIVGGDGELKAGGYALLPHSVHPSGKRYEWLNEPTDLPFISDIQRAGLVPSAKSGTQEIQGLYGSLENCFGTLGITVEMAIESSQPTGYGERHHRVFDFCRMLKSTPLANANRVDLLPVFERWFQIACPRIRTKNFQTSWHDFLSGWELVERPYGASIAGIANSVTGDGINRLESLCQELQVISGDRSFYLDGRAAAAVIEKPHRTTARWLKRLVKSGQLDLVKPGDYVNHLAAEYRYLEPQLSRSPESGDIT
jgi:hypothetical protein